jgi:DNA primase
VTEGEIDAMSVVQSGFAAVALGGSSISASQVSLLRNSQADEIVIFTDNDEAGRKARQAIVDALVGHKRVSVVDWSLNYDDGTLCVGDDFKDANEMLMYYGAFLVRAMIDRRIPIGLALTFGAR